MNILVVDDEKVQIETLRRGLRSKGHKVFEALSVDEALSKLSDDDHEIDLVITDYLMSGDNGLNLLKKIRDLYETLPVILMTAYGEKKLLVDALRNRCNGYIDKPFTLDELMQEIERAEINLLQNTKSEKLLKIVPRLLHQANNPLMTILASAQLAVRKPESGDLKKYIDDIIEGVMQIKEINNKIASLNRPSDNGVENMPLKAVLENSINMFRNLFVFKGIQCEQFQLDEADVMVSGNRFDLEQVFKNLILNAADAMDGCPREKILTISAKINSAAPSVSIHIKDTGSGIPEDQQGKVFTKYFTTKPQGTGLGLHIVKGIVEKHGGTVQVRSKVGEGSEFMVTLPISNRR